MIGQGCGAGASLSVAVDPILSDEHRCPALLCHRPVVVVPVVVCAAGGGEDGAQQQPQPFGIQPGLGVVGAGEFGAAFDRRPVLSPRRAEERSTSGSDAHSNSSGVKVTSTPPTVIVT